MVSCLRVHGDFSFSILVIHTDLFTQLKVMGVFNVHSLEVIILITVIAFTYNLLFSRYCAMQLYIYLII